LKNTTSNCPGDATGKTYRFTPCSTDPSTKSCSENIIVSLSTENLPSASPGYSNYSREAKGIGKTKQVVD